MAEDVVNKILADLITFLISNGYQIETQITNMLNQSDIKLSNRKLGFTVTYYGGSQPNITYMR
jgi:transketolase N-terminal domain/subunit